MTISPLGTEPQTMDADLVPRFTMVELAIPYAHHSGRDLRPNIIHLPRRKGKRKID